MHLNAYTVAQYSTTFTLYATDVFNSLDGWTQTECNVCTYFNKKAPKTLHVVSRQINLEIIKTIEFPWLTDHVCLYGRQSCNIHLIKLLPFLDTQNTR